MTGLSLANLEIYLEALIFYEPHTIGSATQEVADKIKELEQIISRIKTTIYE